MSYLRIPLGEYNKLLEMDSKIAQANIIDYIAFLRKSKSSASVMMYLAAIRKFYMMNDISMNWDRIHSYQGEHIKVAEDRPYTHSEVQQMISHTSIRNRAIILTLWRGRDKTLLHQSATASQNFKGKGLRIKDYQDRKRMKAPLRSYGPVVIYKYRTKLRLVR
jgi:hypothetical protein